MTFYMPVKLYTGSGSFAEQKKEVAALGGKCLIVTGKTSAKKSGALDDAAAVLNEIGVAYEIYDGIAQNPTVASCMEAGKIAADFGAKFILGIGGGSAMDAAKAVAVFAANPEINEDEFYAKKWDVAPMPIVLIGTTSGTGSEVTDVSVLTDSKKKKHSIHDPRMYAAISFGDPKYTMTLPREFTLSTGIDVVAHCTESYFCKKANEISRGLAVRGIKLIAPALKAAAEGKELTLDERRDLYEASVIGGLAICVTGTAFPHNVGYYLTETYRVPHGTACAVFMPELMAHVKVCDPAYTKAFYDGIGMDEEEFISLVKACLPDLGIKMTAEEIDTALPRWENNGSVNNTLGTVTTADIRKILNDKFVK